MPAFALWERGLRGPCLSLLHNRDDQSPYLTETERQKAISAPVRMKDGDEKLALDCLARLYPVPKVAEEL